MCESRTIVKMNLTFFPSFHLDRGPQPPRVFPQKPVMKNVMSQLTVLKNWTVTRRNCHRMYCTIIYWFIPTLSCFPYSSKAHDSTNSFSTTHNSLKNINHAFWAAALVSLLFRCSFHHPSCHSCLYWMKVNIFSPTCYKDNFSKASLYKSWILCVIVFLM